MVSWKEFLGKNHVELTQWTVIYGGSNEPTGKFYLMEDTIRVWALDRIKELEKKFEYNKSLSPLCARTKRNNEWVSVKTRNWELKGKLELLKEITGETE